MSTQADKPTLPTPDLQPIARTPHTARILGVDPGLTRCGFGLVDVSANRTTTFIKVGIAGTAAQDPLDQRILQIFKATHTWLETYQPDALAIERIFAQEQVNTVIGTAHAAGVIIAAAASRTIPVHFHTPSEVKAAVTGSGRADKASVARMVSKILGLTTPPRPADAADALAIAICHGWRGGTAGAGLDLSQGVQTHQGSKPTKPTQTLTPAQKQWLAAESKTSQKNRKSWK